MRETQTQADAAGVKDSYIQSPLGRLALYFITFCLLDAALTWLMFLPEDAYTHRVLFIQPLFHGQGVISVIEDISLVALIVLIVLIVLLRRRLFHTQWNTLGGGQSIRIFMVLVALILAWEFTTYAFNGYFGQSHWLDRALLVCFIPLIAWRPGFVLPFLVVLFPLMNQLDYPLGNYLRATDGLLVHLLVLLAAAWLIAPWRRVRDGQTLVILIGCLIAANYWWPGFGKIRLGWITHGHLYFLLPNAYAHGWLASWSPDQVVDTAQIVSRFDWPMRIATLIFECGALCAILHRRIFMALLVGWIGMHIGIFALMGFCFWKWIVIDVAWLAILARFRRGDAFHTPTILVRGVTVFLIATGGLWCEPPGLAWFDTPVSDRIEFIATDASGNRTVLSPSFFGPYHDQFTMNDFGFAIPIDARQLVHPYGVTQQRAVADALVHVSTSDELVALENSMGGPRWNTQRSAALDELLIRIAHDHNMRKNGVEAWLRFVRPPVLFVSTRDDDHESTMMDIETLTLVRVTTLFDGESIVTVRREPIRTLRIE